jgi:hypothetical protein
MPELYRLADNTHVNTQVEAKHSGQDFEKVDVPTTRKELLAYLNEIVTSSRGGSPQSPPAADEEVVETPELAPDPAPKLAPPPPNLPAAAITLTAVEEFILDHATTAQVCNIFECLGSRFAELQKKVKEAE